MNKAKVRYHVISDIHLGHPRNKTLDVLHALDVYFNNYLPRDDLDILFLAGDVFDRLLDFPMPEVAEITTWLHRLLGYCGRNGIKLRVLEGTPSHDWGQSEIINTLFSVSGLTVDVKYINTLHIEYMDDLGIRVLYVPDEWNSSTDKTFEQVKELLSINHLTQVDIAIMHGNFAYQLPVQAAKAPRHNEQNYLSIVTYFISIGHIHTHSIYERILAQGSFDRLAHGEEEPKGGMECVIYKEGGGDYFFIENKLAKRFITLTLRSKDVDASIAMIAKKTHKLPIDSYVRIRAKKDHPLMIGIDELKKRFPYFVFTKIAIDEVEFSGQLVEDVAKDPSYIPITISKDNIRALLVDEIVTKHALTAAQHSIAHRFMDEVI